MIRSMVYGLLSFSIAVYSLETSSESHIDDTG